MLQLVNQLITGDVFALKIILASGDIIYHGRSKDQKLSSQDNLTIIAILYFIERIKHFPLAKNYV